MAFRAIWKDRLKIRCFNYATYLPEGRLAIWFKSSVMDLDLADLGCFLGFFGEKKSKDDISSIKNPEIFNKLCLNLFSGS